MDCSNETRFQFEAIAANGMTASCDMGDFDSEHVPVVRSRPRASNSAGKCRFAASDSLAEVIFNSAAQRRGR